MIYLRLLAVWLWFFVSCFFYTFVAVFRWGDDNLNHDYGRILGPVALWIMGIQVEVIGDSEAHQPCVYVANHQSNFDVFTCGSMVPSHSVSIGKKEILFVPIFGIFYAAAANIMINRKNKVSAIGGLKQAIEILKRQGSSLWVFAEGTRNRSSEKLLPFKKGAFHMAIEAKVPIVPIVCSPLRDVFNWKARKLPGGKVTIRILPPVSTEGLTAADVSKLSDQVRTLMLAWM
jgi:1-acyl-sn-glycerol-3-phosphate acyltransferase